MNNLQLKNSFERLKIELRQVKYGSLSALLEDDDAQQLLLQGKPFAFLPIVHHCLLVFSPLVAEHITNNGGFDMYAKSDLRFMESAYKLLISEFSFKPAISVHQFFTDGFAEHKLNLCSEIAKMMREKHQELCRNQPKHASFVQNAPNSFKPNEKLQPEENKVRVVRHSDVPQPHAMVPIPSNDASEYFKPPSLPTMFPEHQIEPQPSQSVENTNSFYQDRYKQPELAETPGSIAKQISKQAGSDSNQKSEIMQLLMILNESVRALGSRFDAHQRQTDEKFNKITAELCLLKNRVDFQEANNMNLAKKQFEDPIPKQSSYNRIQSDLNQSSVSNQKSFSEPDDDYIKRIQARYAETQSMLKNLNK